VGVNSRLTQAFTLNANLRYYDKDDQTPTAPNYYTSGADIHYHFGQSMRTLSGKVEGIYRFADVYTLVAGLDEKRQKRELPMVGDTGVLRNVRTSYRDKLNETTGRLELRRSLTDTVNGSVSWVHAKRDGSAYTSQLTANQAFVLANPFNIADRTRNKARLSVDWTPAEAVNLQFVMEDGKDKYSGENLYGMEEGKNRLYSLDASWAINDKLSVNAWYSYDENKARQTGQLGNNTGTQYRYDLKDNANSLGLGVKWEATSALRFGSNLEWMRSASQYGINAWNATTLAAVNPAAGQSYDVPDINNKHLRLSVFATYALNKASTLRFDVIYDKWKTNDWTWVGSDGVSPMYFDATTGVAMRPNQSATFVGVRYIHKFQ
jgi:MtrB/PioB family decaheme-associated outer membrane protein